MGKLTLYGAEASAPVRAVLLTLKALELPYEFVKVNMLDKEHLSAEYLKKNPLHTVPTLEDDGQFLWDSHAINAYLVSKYGKSDELYPKDFFKRAVVDQHLYFENAKLQVTMGNIGRPIVIENKTVIPKEKINKVYEVFDFVETLLTGKSYIAGNQLTIADFSLISTITSLTNFVEIDSVKYVNISAWIKRLEQLPYYAETNGNGLAVLKGLFKSKNITIEK